jgi:hypothetical protein
VTVNSRAKGKRGERELARLLEAWWGKLEPGCEFRSTPSSGGWATPELRGHFLVAGDLVTTATRFPLTVECKLRESWSWAPLLAGRRSPVWGWWRQCERAALEEGRHPALFFRRSREPWHVITGWRLVESWRATHAKAWTKEKLIAHGIDSDLAMVRLDALLAVDPALVASRARRELLASGA